MKFQWDYPLYLIPLGGGYASVVEREHDEDETQAVVVYTSEELCRHFMTRFQILAEPKPIKNARDFAWLLQNLRAPVTKVAFDPAPDESDATPRWSVDIARLLKDHVVIDFSPWNYPVFVVSQGDGFASIEGEASKRQKMRAIALFTDREKAKAYLAVAEEAGSVLALQDLGETRKFLTALAEDANAVALDPIVQNGTQTARHCFEIKTVLDKYLVAQ